MKRVVALGALGLMGTIAACGSGSQGPAGPQGAKGDPGPAGSAGTGSTTPSISDIQPSVGFVTRKAHVTISGYATAWTDATKVDFGAGVTVSNVHAASPTALVADLAIDKAAALGLRDVTVNDAAAKTTYKQAFNVALPAALTLQGSLAQGSIAIANLKLQDTSSFFDTTSTTDPLSGQVTFTNLNFTAPAGVTASVSAATNTTVSILLLTDVDAKVGAADLDLLSGAAGDASDDEFLIPGGLTVAARTATAIGTSPATGTTKTAYDSALFTYTPTASTILDFMASSTASGANPSFALLPKSGHFADIVSFVQPQTTGASSALTLLPVTADPYYVIYWDNSGTTGDYTVSATSTAPAATHATVATDNSKAGAITATALPFLLTGGALADSSSTDWVKVTAAAGDVGKTFHVQTIGDPNADIAVSCYEADGTTPAGTTIDNLGQADGTCPIDKAGPFYVVFGAGSFFDPSANTYEAIIRVQ